MVLATVTRCVETRKPENKSQFAIRFAFAIEAFTSRAATRRQPCRWFSETNTVVGSLHVRSVRAAAARIVRDAKATKLFEFRVRTTFTFDPAAYEAS